MRPVYADGSAGAKGLRPSTDTAGNVVPRRGDPFPTPPPPPAKDDCTLQEGHVHVVNASGRLVAQARLVDARFSFKLRPGRYHVIAWNVGNGPFEEDVELTARETTIANVVITPI
jgi:hypothetical protein